MLLATTALPAQADIYTPDPDTVEVGTLLASQEPIVLMAPIGAYNTDDRQYLFFVTAEQQGTENGTQNVDGVLVPIPSTVGKINIYNDCPEVGRDCYEPISGTPDPDGWYYKRNVDEFGAFDGWEALDQECWEIGEEFDCTVPVEATHVYVTLYTGTPTFVTVDVAEIRTLDVGPCDLPAGTELPPSSVLPHAGQHELWNEKLPMCNHRLKNSWCADNDWPDRVTPGPYGPPGEGADQTVPSRCDEHQCAFSTEAEYTDPDHSCYEPNRTPVDPPEPPEDPVDIVVGIVENLADTDPVEVAEEEANWALNGTAVRWVREFTPARCSETADVAPYGCDEYWQDQS